MNDARETEALYAVLRAAFAGPAQDTDPELPGPEKPAQSAGDATAKEWWE